MSVNRYKIISLLILTASLVVGCHKPEVKFTDIRPAPTATITNNTAIIHIGSDYYNSATYISPRTRIEGQTIYVFGYRTLKEQKRDSIVQLPTSVNPQSVTVEWLNPDGSHVPISITK
jgi:hypothetical protein